MKTPKKDSFVVKWYAVCKAKIRPHTVPTQA